MALAPTFEDYLGIGLAAAAAARNELLLDEGDIAHQFQAAAAAMADSNTEYASGKYRQTFLDGCTGQLLDERVTDRFKELTRKQAASAGASLSIARVSAAAGAGSVAAGSIVASATDSEGRRQEFETLADVFFAVGEVGTKVVLAQARAAGAAGNVAAGRIAQFVSAVFDASLTVTNAAAAAGGADVEGDDEYRSRAREYPGTLVRGTAAAVRAGARTVPGVRIARVRLDAIGIMTVFVADASGGSSQTLIDAVEEELANWVAAGAVFSVVGGEVLLQNLVIGVRLARGRAADVAGLVQRTATQELLKLEAGDTLYVDALKTAIMNLDRTQFLSVPITTPAGDVTPEPQQILRAGTITVQDA